MADETSKQALRRSSDRRFANRWFRGHGIDIGAGADSLANLTGFFPLMQSVKSWDLPDGDAMLMNGVADNSFDFVHSSHCLEHLQNPVIALRNWIRICKEGGYLVVTVPDEDLYEQGAWPSTYNQDHKWTFTLSKKESWSPACISVMQLLGLFEASVEILKMELLDAGYRYGARRFDQTLGPFAESALELVLRKKAKPSAAGESAGINKVLSALFLQALACHQEGLSEQAARAYQDVLGIDPDHLSSLNNLSLLVDSEASERLLRRALRLKPDYRDALDNLAKLQENQSKFPQAIETLQSLTEAQGESVETHYRIARLYESSNATDESLRYFDKALALDPGHRLSHVWKGFALLKKGDYGSGAFELGWIYGNAGIAPQLQQAAGPGCAADLSGKTVVLSADSGLGDTLQYVRYADALKVRGARVIVECQPELVRLIQEGVPAVDQVVKVGELSPGFDLRIPVTLAIGLFGTTVETIPARVPYITAPTREKAFFEQRLAEFEGLKVGLVWAGNPGHWADSRRSLNPSLLATLTQVDRVVFVSLQKNAPGRPPNLVDWTDALHDMADTAALVSSLDLVIAVDSAVAHLAGALGRPIWLLNRFDSCWRWMESRGDSPWYPTMRIFRQPAPNNWKSVLEEVAVCLQARASACARSVVTA